MYERMTERARAALSLAEDEARAFKHHHIGTEHILLGLLVEEEGIAARVFELLDVRAERVRDDVLRIFARGSGIAGALPYTPRAKKVLELSLREALSLGHNYIGTEHLLLGLVRENEGVATRMLLDMGVDSEMIRNEVIRLVSGPGPRQRKPVEQHDLLAGVRQLRLAIDKNVRVTVNNGPSYEGVLKDVDFEIAKIEHCGCTFYFPLDRVASIVRC